MDILMTDEQEMVRDSARTFLEGECSPALVRKMEADPLGYDKEIWSQAAELGWQGISLPEQYGGSGLPLTYLGIILQEVGRALAPIPLLSSAAAALTLAEAGSEGQRKVILPSVADGSLILTWAVSEADVRCRPGTIGMTAEADGSEFVLNGNKTFVDNFAAADKCLVLCRTARAGDGRHGLSLFLVDTDASGISETPLIPTAKDRQSRVSFDGVRVSKDNLVGRLNEGWPVAERMLDRATALLCAQMMGAARKDAELAIEYAKMREAFGQPIGAFQSIQHMCADMIIWIDGGDLLTFEALWKMDQGLPCRVEVSQAKSFCNEKALASARNAQIIHGGIGFMMELDLHLWYRRIASWTMRLGTTYEHRARIAEALLDHPGEVVLGRPLPDSEPVAAEELRKTA
ncbi:acyl-CoA dehydrogenase family protein [Roseitranquillus sediminis]|uniref:acyl-CoA dehydrogenase family protein n=1 Tax=Roseitranquillus sediminis TaxID=2809051 RepID=UPI001D0C9FD4|nr:acyl-CoA dehydrogenase family protein [Roseitranquillus sediminis]MBM9594707.1 acyl-CoA/acyl-ACP dehydrogenase [Roseitranquillus sediminis]